MQQGSAKRGWLLDSQFTVLTSAGDGVLPAHWAKVYSTAPASFLFFFPQMRKDLEEKKNTESEMLQHFLESFLPTLGLKLHF